MVVSRSFPSGRPLALAAVLLAFACAPALASGSRAAADTVNYLQHIVVGTAPCDDCTTIVCPGVPVPVTLSGFLPSRCIMFRGLRVLPTLNPFTEVAAEFFADTCGTFCPESTVFFSGGVSLPPPIGPDGSFVLRALVRSCVDTTVARLAQSQLVTYRVEPECPPPPIPVDSLVQTFVKLDVAPERHCSGDTLSLRLIKNGCPPCVNLTGLGRGREIGFFGTFDWTPDCLEFACIPETLSTPLGVFAPGHFSLLVNLAAHVIVPTNPDSMIAFQREVVFDVPVACDTTPQRCMSPFLRPGALRTSCAVSVAPGEEGELILSAAPPVPLGGLQGRIECTAPFRVANAYSPGDPGLHVSWVAEGRGARYVIFTDPGQAIPPVPGPVLALDIAADAGATPGSRGSLLARVALASDVKGDSVPICPFIPLVIQNVSLCVSGEAEACDANGDGRDDVRDLVLMTRCFTHALTPEDSVRICRDCDGDSLFAFEDLFCCAGHILRLPFVPRDSVHANDAVRVSFDPPRLVGGNYSVHVHVVGARSLGAALVRLSYPADRWRVSLPVFALRDPTPGGAGWLQVVDVNQPGLVHLGGLRFAESVSDDIDFALVFVPVSPLPGDQVVAEGADLGAPDGTVLTPTAALPTLLLGEPGPSESGVLELTSPKPNPFGGITRFSVNLPRAARVDLAVHDLAGRRIATLAHGTQAAGRQIYAWDGSSQRNGLYFIRLTVEGRVLSTRVALRRGAP